MSKKIAVTNNETRILRLDTIALLPGVNFVDEKLFLEESKSVDFWLKAGVMEVMDDTEEEGADASDLASYSARKAKQIVKDTVDGEVLNAWMKTEDRSTVVEEIGKQLQRLEDALKKSDEE